MTGPTSFLFHLSGTSVLHCLISSILKITFLYFVCFKKNSCFGWEGKSSPLTLSWVEVEILSSHCRIIGAQT